MKLIILIITTVLSTYKCSQHSQCITQFDACYYCSPLLGYCVINDTCCTTSTICASGSSCKSNACISHSISTPICTNSSSCRAGYYCSSGSCILEPLAVSNAVNTIAGMIWLCYIGIPIFGLFSLLVGIGFGVRRCILKKSLLNLMQDSSRIAASKTAAPHIEVKIPEQGKSLEGSNGNSSVVLQQKTALL